MATLPTIQAIADEAGLSFSDRVARFKQSFGLPRFITRNFKRPNTPKDEFAQKQTSREQKAFHKQVLIAKVNEPILVDWDNFFLQPDRKDSVLAHVQIADLSKPTPATTKSLILSWMETPVDRIAHISEIFTAFPEVARNGISSRLSELVKSGQLISLGRGSATYQLPTA